MAPWGSPRGPSAQGLGRLGSRIPPCLVGGPWGSGWRYRGGRVVVGVGRERVCARDGWAVVCVHVCVASVVVSIVRWRGMRVAALACVCAVVVVAVVVVVVVVVLVVCVCVRVRVCVCVCVCV